MHWCSSRKGDKQANISSPVVSLALVQRVRLRCSVDMLLFYAYWVLTTSPYGRAFLKVFRTGRERPIAYWNGTIPREITRTQISRVVIWKQKWICHRFTLSFMHDTRCNLLQHNNYQTLGASLRLERRRWRDVLHLNNYGEDHEYEHIYSWIYEYVYMTQFLIG